MGGPQIQFNSIHLFQNENPYIVQDITFQIQINKIQVKDDKTHVGK